MSPGCPTQVCVQMFIWHDRSDIGGATRTNCALFYRKHHKMLHHGWTVTANANHTLTFTAPDNTHYHSHPPG